MSGQRAALATRRQQWIATAVDATHQRLVAAAGPLGLEPAVLHEAYHRRTHDRDPTGALSVLLQQATDAVSRRGGMDRLWLLLAVAQGQLPVQDDVRRLRRHLELDQGVATSRFLLSTALTPAGGFPSSPTALVGDRVLVDLGNVRDLMAAAEVGGAAEPGAGTEMQRVVQQLLGRWLPDRPVLPVTWDRSESCTRTLTVGQQHHLLLDHAAETHSAKLGRTPQPAHLVIPWQVTYLLAEVPVDLDRLDRLSALARYSGSRLVVLGSDLSAASDPSRVGQVRAGQVARYLSAVKHSAKVVALTDSAAEQFTGFTVALSTQGLQPPVVVTCLLPGEPLPVSARPVSARPVAALPGEPVLPDEPLPAGGGTPLVVNVGPLEATTNHLALLQAADILWREGLAFRLRLLGRVGPDSTDVLDRFTALAGAGRDVSLHPDPTGAEQQAAYRDAAFSVSVAVHEALGLQVTASLASHTPVVATRFGSAAEAASRGGALLVDPYDDDDIADAMRSLLTDPELRDELVQRCRTAVPRSWTDFADQLWEHLQPDGQDQA